MKHLLPKKILFVVGFVAILLGFFATRELVHATSVAVPVVTVSPASATTATITVTFAQAVPTNDLIDVEVYNSANQKIWQSFTTVGGANYITTTSQLPAGSYIISVGLFTPNWSSNYAWFSHLSPFTIAQSAPSSPALTSTPVPTMTPAITATPTPVITSQINGTFQTAYNNWKAKYVAGFGDAQRVVRLENNNDTVSEGIGYGMLLSYAASDKATFDGLWKYAQKYLDKHGLMNWQINASGQIVGPGSATDADEDIAYALLKANQKWPGSGYDIGAHQQISSIKSSEVVGSYLNPGDNWGNTSTMNPSYLAPSYYKAFATFTGDNAWNNISGATSGWLTRAANGSTGLVPDWINSDLSPAGISWDTYQHDFYYDAVRSPIRLLLDYKTTGDTNAAQILNKQATFLAGVGTERLKAGYSISGSPLSSYQDTAFRSGYAAAAQINSSSQFANDMLNNLINTAPSGYFGTSLRAITLAIIYGQLQ